MTMSCFRFSFLLAAIVVTHNSVLLYFTFTGVCDPVSLRSFGQGLRFPLLVNGIKETLQPAIYFPNILNENSAN